jgi:hypothetical protein
VATVDTTCYEVKNSAFFSTQYIFTFWYSFRALKSTKFETIPLEAWTGPEGSSRLKLPDIKEIGTWRW